MEIRKFTPNDIEAVFAIQKAAYKPLYDKYRDEDTSPYTESRETVLEKYTRTGTQGYLFFLDNVPVGAVRIRLDPENRSARVSALGVLPAYQGRGIAQEALRSIEALHPEAEKWSLDTILQEKGNCHLYEKLGYIRTGKTQDIHEGMTLVFYEKQNAAIRIAEESDAEQLRELNEAFNGAGETSLEHIRISLAENRQEIVIVADEGGILCGFVCVQLKKSFCYDAYMPEITEVYVRPAYRRRGIASRMLVFAQESCKKRFPLQEFTLLTGKDNFPARSVYRRLGFTEDGEAHLSKEASE